MKLWAGRFQKETDALVNDFNSSISFDARMYREDITGSIAHAAMLGRQGIIKEHEAEKIIDGLKAILADIEAGQVEFSLENEDIHMNIETILTQRIGDTGKRLHTARSRNDQVAVDFRMYVRKEIQAIIGLILDLEKVLVRKAEANLDTVMPGYTHLQRAQPTTFAHAMMAYANMFKRDVTRLEDCLARMDECPLGAGALATSTYPVDRFQTAQALGFSKPTDNSLDSVSDRDFALEFLSACSILMMHLSRFSEEIILWCSWEFKFVELDDAYYKGMATTIQLHNRYLRGQPTAREICHILAAYYAGQPLVSVRWGGDAPTLPANALAGTDRLELVVCGHEEQTIVTALFDNLGKGASGAAVQNMNLMLGFEMTAGLALETPPAGSPASARSERT